ncbi:MAG: hypothetical protein R2708_17430 [Vicinamibacterales bacterium]
MPRWEWLKARGVALIGNDDASTSCRRWSRGKNLPVHTLAITALGLNILDNQDLEAVAALAAARSAGSSCSPWRRCPSPAAPAFR